VRAARPKGAVRGLVSGFAALWLVCQPVLADAAREPAAKSDKLVVTPSKGDLLNRKPDRAKPGHPAAKPTPPLAPRGTRARELIDVAVRGDGLWLNSFATRTMPLDALACAELSNAIVSRLALPTEAVQRLAEEDLMRQTRVCAVNGSLLVTCYGGAATVSLRPSQHGDGCGG
jgi:hypothetical protein